MSICVNCVLPFCICSQTYRLPIYDSNINRPTCSRSTNAVYIPSTVDRRFWLYFVTATATGISRFSVPHRHTPIAYSIDDSVVVIADCNVTHDAAVDRPWTPVYRSPSPPIGVSLFPEGAISMSRQLLDSYSFSQSALRASASR